jgi:hypothetical protein
VSRRATVEATDKVCDTDNGKEQPMFKRMAIVVALALFALAPASLLAQEPGPEDVSDLLLRVNGPIHIAAGDSARTVMVISDNALIEGTVKEQLVIISGDATVTGTVEGNVLMINGTLTLAPTAVVDNDVRVIHGTLNRADGATVVGAIHEQSGFTVSAGFMWMLWLGMSVLVLAAGAAFAAVGGRQLGGAARIFTTRPGETVLTALVTAITLPILAVIAFVTIVGIPLGFGILFFVIPALWFIGYLVAGTALGMALVQSMGKGDGGEQPYVPALVGLGILQVVGFIPWIGGAVVFFAGTVGAGALVYRAWNIRRGTRAPRPVPAPAT